MKRELLEALRAADALATVSYKPNTRTGHAVVVGYPNRNRQVPMSKAEVRERGPSPTDRLEGGAVDTVAEDIQHGVDSRTTAYTGEGHQPDVHVSVKGWLYEPMGRTGKSAFLISSN